MNSKGIKRLGIFVELDTETDSYVEYLLDDISKVLDEIIVFSNQLNTISRFNSGKCINNVNVIQNNNTIFELVQCIVEFTEKNKFINYYDEIVFFNDSFFGPFISFEEIFEKMKEQRNDLWGFSKKNDFCLDNKHEWSTHIDNSFIVLKNTIFSCKWFNLYWREMKLNPAEMSYNEIMDTLLAGLSNEGFICSSFEDLFHCDTPILKHDMLMRNYEDILDISGGEDRKTILSQIEQKYKYDIDMIWNKLLKKYNIYDIKQNLQLNYVLPKDVSVENCIPTDKIAVIIHVFYEDVLTDIYNYARSIPSYIDLYITTSVESIIDSIGKIFVDLKCNKLEIRKVDGRGRDLSALCIGCKDIFESYDIVCFTHDKKTTKGFTAESIGKSFMHTIVDNTIGSTQYINNILNEFKKNPRLGVLSPPQPLHSIYFRTLGREWGICFDAAKEALKMLGCTNAMISINKQPFVLGSSFWFRTKALKNLTNCKLEYFPQEPMPIDGSFSHGLERAIPYIAQNNGFYSAWVMTDKYAETEVSNRTFMLNNIVGNVRKNKYEAVEDGLIDFINTVVHDEYVGKATLYIDFGDGFNQQAAIEKEFRCSSDGLFFIEFELSNYEAAIKSIRFDPTELQNIIVCINSMQSDNEPINIEFTNGYGCGNNMYFFEEDPWFILNGKFGNCVILSGIMLRCDSLHSRYFLDNYIIEKNTIVLIEKINGEVLAREEFGFDGDGNFKILFKTHSEQEFFKVKFTGRVSGILEVDIDRSGTCIVSCNGIKCGENEKYLFKGEVPEFVIRNNKEKADIALYGKISKFENKLGNIECIGIYISSNGTFSQDKCISKRVLLDKGGNFEVSEFISEDISDIRIDMTEQASRMLELQHVKYDDEILCFAETNCLCLLDNDYLYEGADPYFVYKTLKSEGKLTIKGKIIDIPVSMYDKFLLEIKQRLLTFDVICNKNNGDKVRIVNNAEIQRNGTFEVVIEIEQTEVVNNIDIFSDTFGLINNLGIFIDEEPEFYKIIGGQYLFKDRHIFRNGKMHYLLEDLNRCFSKIRIIGNIDITEKNLQNINKMRNVTMKLYFDEGNGFDEDNSYKVECLLNSTGEFSIKYTAKRLYNIKRIRFDPCEEYAFCKIDKFAVNNECFFFKKGNSKKIIPEGFLFLNENPMLTCKTGWKNIQEVIIEGKIVFLNKEDIYNTKQNSFWRK